MEYSRRRLWCCRYVAVMLLLLAALPPVAAKEYLCRFVGIVDGLSQSYVTSMARDSRGFLWVGTRFGLNRYDFKNCDNYYHEINNERSIPDNNVRQLYTDSRGRLWVACERGTAYYNEKTNDFTPVRYKGAIANVRSFYDDGNGVILGGAGKLFYYAADADSLSLMPTKGGSTMYYTKIIKYDSDRLMLVTRWDGIWLYDIRSKHISRMPGIRDKAIIAAALDGKGDLWVSPYGRGVYRYASDGHCVDSINKSNSRLTNDIILDLMVHKGQVWMASDGGGISIYDPVRHDFEAVGLASSKAVTVLCRDRHDNLYGGTVRDGFMTIRRAAMKTYQNNPEEGTSVSAIISICRDSAGTLWLGADGNGVLRMTENNRLQNIRSTLGMKVLDLVPFDDNTMLVASYDRGFFLLDKQSLQLRPAPEPINRLYREYSSRSLAVHVRDLGDGKIALVSDRLSIYDVASNTISEPMGESGSGILPIYHSSSLVMCCCNEFVCEYDLGINRYRKLITTVPGERIICARFDGGHNIYFTTGTDVRRYDLTTGTTTTLELENLQRISSLAVDGDYLWIGSNRSIYLLDMKLGKLLEFGESDGVAPNEYLANAVLFTPEALYLGGVTGLLQIDRGDMSHMLSHEAPLTLNVADLIIDGMSAYSLIHDGTAEIAPNYTTMRLKLIADGGNYLQRQPIRYRIYGGDIDRVIESSEHSIDLSMLKEGETYRILTSTTLPDGSWSNERELITMHMLAPWYTSDWLIATVCLLFLLGMAWLELQRRRRHRRRMERSLEDYRNSSLEKELAFLVNTNYALRTPLTLIYAPVKHLIEQARRSEQNANLEELTIIYSNAKKMRDAIDMALELHREGFEKAEVNLARHSIHRLLDKVVDSRRTEADLKRIGIVVDAPADSLYVRCDSDRMSIILGTFIDNALHRSTENSIVRVVARYSDDSRKMLRIIISDNGQSLGDDQLSLLFSKYSTDSSAIFGNALAFAYAKTMAQAQNGSVGANSNSELPGLDVWVDIPVDSAEKSASKVPAMPDKTSESLIVDTDTSGMTALVVEDDKDLCLFISASLAPHFGRILHAFNGKDAWLLIQQHQPDIVISSLMLSAKSGLELCHDLKTRAETSHIPVILLSAFKDDPELERGYSVGADSYLSKPFDINVLLTRCRSLLHNRSVLRKRYESSASGTARLELPNASESFLMKIDKMIEENISAPDFGVDMLLEQLMMSRTALYSKFREITGTTIGNYITEYRLRKAKELLQDKQLTVSEISEHLGFSTQRYFSTFFKEHTGQSPSQFRRMAR